MTDDADPCSNIPPRIDTSHPHSARIWNYWLGGKDYYPIDREMGERIQQIFPGIVDYALQDRAFLGRAVRHLAGEVGIDQFLDIGTGLPTVDNTHEVAQNITPRARGVYVDNDPLVLAHARALLVGSPEGATDYIDADLREPETILREAAQTLDFRRPVGLMLLGVVNFIADDAEARSIIRRLSDALPPGSYLALAHPTIAVADAQMRADFQMAVQAWNRSGEPKLVLRSPEQLGYLLDGLELLEPGIVTCARWRPDPLDIGEIREVPMLAVMART
ncbi:SAM-dependent methyltransferase [Allosalinactinospora lopnorensis]|uniref:SAM-dependent methyltransferase n=1 Tax=Allosalinactinospora lopnorensis TaxID=1352348 RepID=UPI000623EA4C|nr:SAM-dependent methyltransferase [Allosalinactinospora lopnorensis]